MIFSTGMWDAVVCSCIRRICSQVFHSSCGRLHLCMCDFEALVLTISGTSFPRSSLLLSPRNLFQLYHPHPDSDILVDNVAMKHDIEMQL